jgi:rhodanese-related sulfurtransferase
MIPQLKPVELLGRKDAGETFYLVDVRQPWEYEYCHLADAVLIPLPELASRLEEVTPPADATIIVYCHHGIRSLNGAAILLHAGFPRVFSLAGGIDLWSKTIDPKIPTY